VVGNQVFVTDFDGGVLKGDPGKRDALTGHERLLALDATNGNVQWQYRYPCKYNISYPAGPRCTPTVDGDMVYTLGAEGHLACVTTAGRLVWKRELKDDYKIASPIWGFAGHPLVEGDKLICLVGGDGTTLVAFNKKTGDEIWRSLSSREPGYCAPSIVVAGGQRQVILWTPEAVYGVNPESGVPYWNIPLEPQYGMSIMAPRRAGDYLFAGGIGFASALMKLGSDKPGAELVWRGKKDTSVYPVNSTPIVDGMVMYGVDQPGVLRAVELPSGKRLWETTQLTTGTKPANSGTAFLVKNDATYYLFNEKGDLITASFTPQGFKELSRANLLAPTGDAFGRPVVWSHPAFARRAIFARNDQEIVAFTLSQ
jgi:outer membrane protein assembly factor BamB